MHTSWKNMAHGVRITGALMRKLFPVFTEDTFRKQNRLLDKLLKGRWLGRHTRMEEIYTPRADGSMLRLCVIQPKKPRGDINTGMLWIHGGGYALGLPEQDFAFADRFAQEGSCALVLPDYRRSLDAPYPAALEDCYTALLWMKHHAEQLHIRTDRFFTGGNSAGGGLCAALSLYARDKGEVDIAFQMPLYPMLDDRMLTPSSHDNDAPVWNSQSNENAWRLYLRGIPSEEVPVYAAPARAERLHGLPPAFSFVGDLEPFRDETVIWFRKLKYAGIPAQLEIFKGCYHAFDILAPFSKPARQARALMMDAFNRAQQS